MYSQYFNKFPKIPYGIENGPYSKKEAVTNIFFRLGILRTALQNGDAYYVYDVEEGDTPEIIAEKVYGDSNAGWIILYANQMIDPQFDWPLTYDQLNRFVAGKYKRMAAASLSISVDVITDQQVINWAKNIQNVHHYEQVITRTNGTVVTEQRIEVSKERLTAELPDAPFLYWDPYYLPGYVLASSTQYHASSSETLNKASDIIQPGALSFAGSYNTYSVNGKTVTEEIRGEAITWYDHEVNENEKKRSIKVIKAQFYDQIMTEFNRLTRYQSPYIRRLA